MRDKILTAMEILKQYEPEEGYLLGFSGGKDSIVIYHLAKMAGVKFQAIHNYTTVGIPSVIRMIRKDYPDVKFIYPKETMFQLIAHAGLPNMRFRFCCSHLKEYYGWGKTIILGVRWAESRARKNRSLQFQYYLKKMDKDVGQEECERRYKVGTAKKIVNIIVEWTNEDVWDFIKYYKLPYPDVYDNGFKRVGCIGCPMSGKAMRLKQFEMFPNHKKAYIWAIQKYLEKSVESSKDNLFTRLGNAQLIFKYWVSGLSEEKFKQRDWRDEL